MPYALGIDIRAGSTVAAVARLYRDRWEPPEVVLAIPSALAMTADGPVAGVPGSGPDVVRGFVDRIGDEVPLVVGGRPYRAAPLAAELIDHVVRRVEAAEGGPAGQIAVAVPGTWGPYRTGLLRDALAREGLDATLVPAPVAAVAGYAAAGAADADELVVVHLPGDEYGLVRRTAPDAAPVPVEPDLVALGAAQRLIAPPDAVATCRPAPDEPRDAMEEPAYPPPRPPVVITALTEPRSRAAGRRPGTRVLVAGLAVLVIALGVWLTLMSGFVRL
jgi:hypothetical protein